MSLIISRSNEPGIDWATYDDDNLLLEPFEFEHAGAVFGPTEYYLYGQLHVPHLTPRACKPIAPEALDKVLLVLRGGCNFYEKALAAQDAGARAIIVGNNNQQENGLVRMDWAQDDISSLRRITIPCVFVSKATFELLHSLWYRGRSGYALMTIDRTRALPLNITIEGPSEYDLGFQPLVPEKDSYLLDVFLPYVNEVCKIIMRVNPACNNIYLELVGLTLHTTLCFLLPHDCCGTCKSTSYINHLYIVTVLPKGVWVVNL